MTQPARGKAAPFKRTAVPNLVGKGPFDEITRAELVAFLATHLHPRRRGDDISTLHGKASSKIHYHIHVTKTLRPSATGLFQLGTIAEWAVHAYPGKHLAGLPGYPRKFDFGVAMLPALTGSGSGYELPQSLAAAIREIQNLHTQLCAMAQKLALAEGRVRQLEPDATKYRDWNNSKRGKRT